MEAVLSLGFTDRVLANIFLHQEERACELSDRLKRYAVTSGSGFVFPFSHAVVHGLYSGEHNDKIPARWLKKLSCKKAANISYHTEASRTLRRNHFLEATLDVFDSTYGLGFELFHDVEGLRDESRRITRVTPSQGSTLIHLIVEGLSINVEDRERFSKSLWLEYARGITPPLFRF